MEDNERRFKQKLEDSFIDIIDSGVLLMTRVDMVLDYSILSIKIDFDHDRFSPMIKTKSIHDIATHAFNTIIKPLLDKRNYVIIPTQNQPFSLHLNRDPEGDGTLVPLMSIWIEVKL